MLSRYAATILLFIILTSSHLRAQHTVVADSASRRPLPNASVYDRRGAPAGMTDAHGRLPRISSRDAWPLTVTYLGYRAARVSAPAPDTVFLAELVAELPEVVVETRSRKVLHMLAYVREYSTLTTYSDTVFLFREKMADFMLTPDRRVKFRGWTAPRLLTSKSYYRFTDCEGLDSVGDRFNNHFSWSDWVGIPPAARLPRTVACGELASDTLRGRYSASEIWSKDNDRVSVYVDVLADTARRRWVPDLAGFFRRDIDFERFRMHFDYENVDADSVTPLTLSAYTYDIESNGRGINMFRFNSVDQPYFVSTHAEVYILDREYITVKEAKKWARHKFCADSVGIVRPFGAPELDACIQALIARVDNLESDHVRQGLEADDRLAGGPSKANFGIGHRALTMLKELVGISRHRFYSNFNRSYNSMKGKSKPSRPLRR